MVANISQALWEGKEYFLTGFVVHGINIALGADMSYTTLGKGIKS